MKLEKLFFLLVTAFFSTLMASGSALSAYVDVSSAASIKAPITADIYQQLYFGTIAPSLTQADTVKVLRHINNSSICGNDLTCFENGNRARMLVTGEPYKIFVTSNPGPITLSDGQGSTMLVDNWVGGGSDNNISWGPTGHLNSNGYRNQNFGATLHVGANQPVGTYTGSYTVSVEYQ